ncbi:hypothetical protein [Paenibacillus sp. P46E]|uniref:hypothetical protein n=1 Tax=Paenibacillus sp. P46E TaxID=1349436 RepID=UPI00093F8E1F|nr:hypothetical protein [Paenibacillus sp. P46E]OKP97798.1 hypothetical protein A3849_13930 [Paenibacillus sp. P46E]
MWVKQEGDKRKTPVKGQCVICNDPKPTKHTILKASFCQTCWDLMLKGDEEALSNRTVWN